jgi:molybdopterin-containing oxidoreductase family membrane subunit
MFKIKLREYLWYGFLVIIVIIGIYNFYLQTKEGHHLTGVSKDVPWGIYIAAFIFFVGASAGATLIGFLIHAFGRNDYKPLGIRAIVMGIVSLVAAILFIMVDVGQPLRMLKVPWLLHNPTSMFFISSTSYYLFMVLLFTELYYALKIVRQKASEKEKKIAKWLAILAVPYALLIVHMVTGFIFGVIKTREYWNTSLLPMHFIIAALTTGIAIMILSAIFSSRLVHRVKPLISRNTLNHMGLLLASFAAITLLFDLSDMIVLKYSDKPDGIDAWNILTEQHTVLFLINVLCLATALFILVFKRARTANWLILSSLLVLVSIGAYRYNLVIVPQKVPLLPGLPEIQYFPNIIEFSITVGIVAFVMLLYWATLKVKPIKMALKEEYETEMEN